MNADKNRSFVRHPSPLALPEPPKFPLGLYYDGSCAVCAAEVEHYRRKDLGGRLVFIDISAKEFHPDLAGFSLDELMYQIHAIDRRGHVYRGSEAFWAVWQAFRSSTWYGFLGALVTLLGFHWLVWIGYWCFARTRRWLAGRRDA